MVDKRVAYVEKPLYSSCTVNETKHKPPSSWMGRLGQYIRLIPESIRSFASISNLKAHLSNPLYINGYYLMGNFLATAVSGFAFWIIAANFYSDTDVGIASAMISAMSLLSLFSTLGLGFGLIRFLPGAGDKSTKMINSCFTISALVSVVVAAIYVAGLPIWSPKLGELREHPIWAASFVAFTAVYAISSTVDTVFIAERTAKSTFVKSVVNAILKLPLPIAFASLFGAFGIFASAGLAITAAMGLALFWLLPRSQRGYVPLPAWHRSVVGEMLRYSLGTYLANLLWLAPQYLFPLLVVNILGGDVNAHFYIAWSIAYIPFLIPIAMSYSLFAEGSHDESGLRRDIRRALVASLLIVITVMALIFALGDKVLLLFGREYSETATSLLWVLSLSAIPLTINYIFLALYRVRKNITVLLIASAGATCLSLGFSYVLMRELGLIGVGLGWTLGQSIVAAIVVVPLLRQSRSLPEATNR